MAYAIAFLVGLAIATLLARWAWRKHRHEQVRTHVREVCADVDRARTRAPWLRYERPQLRMEQPGAVASRLHGKRSA